MLLVVAATILAGCGSVPVPPTYTQGELKAECERHMWWWHPDDLTGRIPLKRLWAPNWM
jgi:hypothetical protein